MTGSPESPSSCTKYAFITPLAPRIPNYTLSVGHVNTLLQQTRALRPAVNHEWYTEARADLFLDCNLLIVLN